MGHAFNMVIYTMVGWGEPMGGGVFKPLATGDSRIA